MPTLSSSLDFLEQLPVFYNSGQHYDVVFHCMGGQSLRAHRLILGCWSPMLKLLFDEQRDRDFVEISLPNIEAYNLDLMLRFLYEGTVRLNHNELQEFNVCKEALSLKFVCVCVNDAGEEVEVKDAKVSEENMLKDEKIPEENMLKDEKTPEENIPERVEAIKNINALLGTFSKTPDKVKSKNPKKRPVLVPLEHYQTAVRIVEKRKAEKKLETLVEVAVQKRMKLFLSKMKLERKKRNTKKENQEGQLLPNPLVKKTETSQQPIKTS